MTVYNMTYFLCFKYQINDCVLYLCVNFVNMLLLVITVPMHNMFLLTLAQNCIVQNEASCLITGGFTSNSSTLANF